MDDNQEESFIKDLQIKEDKILREAIFALQGIDGGDHMQFDWSGPYPCQQRLTLRSDLEINGNNNNDNTNNAVPPTLLTKSKLGSGVADALSIIGETGWLYSRVQSYIEHIQQGGEGGPLAINQGAGAIQRGLTMALVDEMNAYRTLLVELEANCALEESSNGNNNKQSHLRHLLASLYTPTRRLQSLAMLTDGLSPQMTGGPLLRALEEHSRHGDPRHADLVLSLLAASSRPWYEMLFYWTTQGLLPEKRTEFFVQQTPDVADRNMWRDRYHIDAHQLPPRQILPDDIVRTAFQVGKGIHFIRHCLLDGEYSLKLLEEEARRCFAYIPSPVGGVNTLEPAFRDCLQRTADMVNKHILHSLREEYHLLRHLYCLKQFLLLGQGDFVANLTETLHNEFENHQGVVGIYRHTLSSLMEGALRSSNASYLPEEFLKRLYVELRLSPEDKVNYKFGPDKETENDTRTVWDIFQLEYTIPEPILALFDPKLMAKYRELFCHLFALRKVEYYLNFTWRQSAMLSHALQSTAQYSGIKVRDDPHYARAVVLLRRIAITRQSMTNFVVNLKSFLMLEVIEGGWKQLERKVVEAESLDALIAAHEDFITAVCRQSVLYSADDDIRRAVKDLLELCNQFSLYQRNLFGQALRAADLASQKRQVANKREREGDWGFDETENTQFEETTYFGLADVSKLQDLDILSEYFHETILNLLQALDSRLNGSEELGIPEVTYSTPTDQRKDIDTTVMDDDLKLLRFLRAQLDQNNFYGKELSE